MWEIFRTSPRNIKKFLIVIKKTQRNLKKCNLEVSVCSLTMHRQRKILVSRTFFRNSESNISLSKINILI